MGTLLALVSIILSLFLYPFALVTSLFKYVWKRKFWGGLKNFDNQMLDIATSIDANGNVVCEDLFNLCLIKPNGYKFGNRKETISSCLGKNEYLGSLTTTGKIVAFILGKIETNHAIKSIDNNV
ncbi:hypothetical protein [Flavobacterium sp.]|uniref:hypothetical protein n=1 Tax=Flavobacterium sp. TaxID=239 RepID=UPI00374DDD37